MEYLLASVSTTNNNPSSSSSSSVSHDDPLFQICLEGLRKLPLLTRDSNNDLCPHLEVFFTEVTARLLRLATADAMDDDCKADLMAAFWDCANHCVDSIIQQGKIII